jgi:hypothetical protein
MDRRQVAQPSSKTPNMLDDQMSLPCPRINDAYKENKCKKYKEIEAMGVSSKPAEETAKTVRVSARLKQNNTTSTAGD